MLLKTPLALPSLLWVPSFVPTSGLMVLPRHLNWSVCGRSSSLTCMGTEVSTFTIIISVFFILILSPTLLKNSSSLIVPSVCARVGSQGKIVCKVKVLQDGEWSPPDASRIVSLVAHCITQSPTSHNAVLLPFHLKGCVTLSHSAAEVLIEAFDKKDHFAWDPMLQDVPMTVNAVERFFKVNKIYIELPL